MIQLNSKPLAAIAVQHLESVQQRIDDEVNFSNRTERAQLEWASKATSAIKKATFGYIRNTLVSMCVSTEICNYCENNEATDIEHIYPKSLFPERAFRWDNYLLSCSTCNSRHKSDQFAIFDPVGSSTYLTIARNSQPISSDSVFINPRVDNPLDFFWLDIESRTFHFTPKLGLSERDHQRAIYTQNILGLNSRNAVVAARERAAKHYIDRLERYVHIKRITNMTDLLDTVPEPHLVDIQLPFEQEKDRILDALKNDILTYDHPTVWYELLRQRTHLPKTDRFLTAAPEALLWKTL